MWDLYSNNYYNKITVNKMICIILIVLSCHDIRSSVLLYSIQVIQLLKTHISLPSTTIPSSFISKWAVILNKGSLHSLQGMDNTFFLYFGCYFLSDRH